MAKRRKKLKRKKLKKEEEEEDSTLLNSFIKTPFLIFLKRAFLILTF